MTNEKKRGRPRKEISPAVRARILREVGTGKSLRRVLKMESMPSMTKVLSTLQEDSEFERQYARAKRRGIELHIDGILDLADTANADNAHAVRLRVDTRKWLASKLVPKLYGDHVDISADLTIDPRSQGERENALMETARELAHILGTAAMVAASRADPVRLPAPTPAARAGNDSAFRTVDAPVTDQDAEARRRQEERDQRDEARELAQIEHEALAQQAIPGTYRVVRRRPRDWRR